MFNKINYILVIVSLMILFGSSVRADYWYGVDGTVPLTVDSSKVLLMFESGFGPNQQEEVLESIGRIATILDDELAPCHFVVCSLSTSEGYDSFLDSLDDVAGIDLVEPYYLSSSGQPMLAGEGICVAFNEELSTQEITDLAQANGLTVDRALIGLLNVYVLLNTSSSDSRSVEMANTLHNNSSTRYAQPDFSASITTNSYRLFDYYNQYQPHTKKVIGQFNQASVWDFPGLTKPIKVAVVDEGVTLHEDLPANRVTFGYDFAGGYPNYVPDSDPAPGEYRYHGMACAGIIAASHTTDSLAGLSKSTGVISIDPSLNVMPIKIFDDSGKTVGVTISDLADAIGYAWVNGADIISNSWGFRDPDEEEVPIINEAIERAFYFGRNGLGCPVIFSSGNTTYWYPNPNGVAYPAHLDECFAVGAIELDDDRWYYSRYGAELDMVAPSDDGNTVGVWSLDQMGSLGKNPTSLSNCPPGDNDVDYHCSFGGTSAACPVVAGVAALLLSKDSTLSAQAVYYILRNSAVTELDWGTITPPTTQYGYGRVDAFRAILSLSRGDINGSGAGPDISDLVYFITYLFSGGPAPFPTELLGDVDCSGQVDVADPVYLSTYMFSNGPPIPYPCFEYGD